MRTDAPANQWPEPNPTSSAPVRVYLRLVSGTTYVFNTDGPPDAVLRDNGSGVLILDSDTATETARTYLFGATTILIAQ